MKSPEQQLQEKNQYLRLQIKKTEAQISIIEEQLSSITSAKFYKLWMGIERILGINSTKHETLRRTTERV